MEINSQPANNLSFSTPSTYSVLLLIFGVQRSQICCLAGSALGGCSLPLAPLTPQRMCRKNWRRPTAESSWQRSGGFHDTGILNFALGIEEVTMKKREYAQREFPDTGILNFALDIEEEYAQREFPASCNSRWASRR